MTEQAQAAVPVPVTPPVAVTVRLFAAARAAAGVDELAVRAATVEDVVAALGADRPELARVLVRCSFLVDEVAVRDRRRPLRDGAVVDVLPPFAGG